MPEVIAPDDLIKMRANPFDKYLDGQIWYLTNGVDYDCPPSLLIKRIRYRARQFGLRIHVRDITDNGFRFFAYTSNAEVE